MIYLGDDKIGRLYLGDTEIGKAYLGSDLVFQKGGGPTPAPVTHYKICGSPTIADGIMTPDTADRGFIYTDQPFDPGTNGWIIQTKIKINTSTAYKDIISSVNSNGDRQYSVGAQFGTQDNNARYGLYLSSNGTSWNIANFSPHGTMTAGTWRVFQIVCTRSGSNYLYKMGYPELSSWSENLTKNTHPLWGKYISFGGGFANTSIDCEIDLSETKIWIGGNLWWEAITSNE